MILPDWPNDNNGCCLIMYQLPRGGHPGVIQEKLIPIYQAGYQWSKQMILNGNSIEILKISIMEKVNGQTWYTQSSGDSSMSWAAPIKIERTQMPIIMKFTLSLR